MAEEYKDLFKTEIVDGKETSILENYYYILMTLNSIENK